jgi:hypothetical protein
VGRHPLAGHDTPPARRLPVPARPGALSGVALRAAVGMAASGERGVGVAHHGWGGESCEEAARGGLDAPPSACTARSAAASCASCACDAASSGGPAHTPTTSRHSPRRGSLGWIGPTRVPVRGAARQHSTGHVHVPYPHVVMCAGCWNRAAAAPAREGTRLGRDGPSGYLKRLMARRTTV